MVRTIVTVVVLGDIGRSPRMQYHASSLLKQGFYVNFLGYDGSKPIECIRSDINCKIKYLPQPPKFFVGLPVILAYMLKILWQVFTLVIALMSCCRPQQLLVQTPPAIPALLVCWGYCRLVQAKFVIDWHNYAFSIMALTHGKNHKIVKVSEQFEGFFGRKADGNLCVTKAMKNDLMKRWKVSAVTLYDRPPDNFGPISAEEQQTLMNKYDELKTSGLVNKEGGVLPADRPGLLVSSTSWTEDEDFSILLSALQEYDNTVDTRLPKLLCVITGKGPLREHYLQQVASQKWGKVTIVSIWLEAADYPRLLASADLGVSLHTSSSGLDLPMKVVDMLGCGLPVAALHFSCLEELVRHNENSLVFHDSSELAEQLKDWFRDFPSNKEKRERFNNSIQKFQDLRWHDNWTVQALPLFITQ